MKNRLKILGNRTIGVITILTLLTYIFVNIINTNTVYAAQTKEAYDSNKIAKYSGYKELIEKVKTAHPNWNIKIHYTNLDWNTVIKNETTERHARNLVSKNNTSNWFCSVCKDKPYDNGSWRCASEEAVSYYMDPRNFMDDNSIIQFEQSIFNSAIHSVDGIMNMTTGSFLAGRENADAILEACKRVNINPYQIVARILQEQGKNGSTMSRGNEGFYNVFNVGASGNTTEEIIRNATQHARQKGWDTLAKSILGGIDFLKSKYIGIGQDTLYLQKFDVDTTDGETYWHQYMQNLSAALTESYKVRDIYQKMGTFNSSITLCIPVYENMPSAPCQKPGVQNIVTQNAQIKAGHTGINVRETPSTSAKSLREINSGEKFLRIEIGTQNIDKYYWDKIVLSDGTIGYIATDFIEQINDIATCNETVKLTGSDVRLRNGPGTSRTTVKEYLNKGQTLTRIEKNKYNLDGLYWDRVITSSGLQGYVASNYLELVSSNDRFKTEGTNIVCEPYTAVENIKAHHSNAVIKKANGEVVTTGQIGTGFTVTMDNKTYTVVKYGDINGDGKLNSGDSLTLSKQVLGKINLTDAYILKAADINKDGKLNSGDTLILRKQILGTQNISI